MVDIQPIILFITCLPWCLSINLPPSNSPDVEPSRRLDWDAKFIELHGGVYSLHDIYGDDIPGLENVIEPGQAILNSDFKTKIVAAPALSDTSALESIKYMDRELILLNSMIMPSDSLESTIKVSGYDIAAAIVDDLNSLLKGSQVFLLGEMQSGKTAELLKIERILHRRLKGFWTVRLSIDDNFPPGQDIHGVIKYIADTHITENCRQLFLNVFEINPRKLIFLIDDVDAIPAKTTPFANLPNFVIELKNHGTTTVMTGSKKIQGLIMQSMTGIVTGNAYEIPEMSVTEVEKYLKNTWNIPQEHLHQYENSLAEYVTVFTEILFHTSIPRYPGILKTLAGQFKHRSLPSTSGQTVYNVGCDDYIFEPETLPGNIYSSLKHTPVNMYKFYSEYLNSLSWYKIDKTLYDLEHGRRALLNIGYEIGLWKNFAEIPLDSRYSAAANNWDFVDGKSPLLDEYGKFYHSPYKYYFATKYLQLDGVIDMYTHEQLQKIFSDSRSLRLLEMVNFAYDGTVKTDVLMSSIVSNDVEIFHPILDAIVKYGFENLFLQVHKTISESGNLKILHDYFSERQEIVHATPDRYFGMIKSENSHIGFPIKKHNEIAHHPKSRLECLVENDMYEAIKILSEDKIKFRVDENYQVILRKVVTKSLPNLQLLQRLVNDVFPAMKNIDYNDLLYRTVSEVGSPCEPIAKYLVKLGANPNYISPNGKTLLHAAVQWGSRRLAKVLVEDLNVPVLNAVDSTGKSVFRTALEVNPSPVYTLNNYWDMMLYLSKKMNYGPQFSVGTKFDGNLFISPSDAQSSWIKVIFSTPDSIDMNKLNFNAAEVKINPLRYSDPMNQRFAALSRAVPSIMWDVLPETRGLRFNHLLHDINRESPSTLELLARLRGRSELSISDHQAYRETIVDHWIREKNVLHFRDRTRIFSIFTNNIQHEEDIKVLSTLVERNLLHKLHHRMRSALAEELAQCLENTGKKRILSAEKLPWKEQLLKANINEQPPIHVTPEFEGTVKPLVKEIKNSDTSASTSDYNSRSVIQCLKNRKKRYTHSINCFFEWSDVDRFNEASENLRTSASDIIVNSDHFITTIAEIESTEPNRARQLTSLVDGLITERGFSSVVTGRRQSLVRDVIEHGSMQSLRLYEQATDTIHDLWDPSSVREPSEPHNPIVLQSHGLGSYIAMSIPAMMSLYHVVNECSKKANNTSCTTASLELTKAVVLGPGGMLMAEYTPWIIDRATRFPPELLSSRIPRFIVDKLQVFRYVGLKYVAPYVGHALIALGVLNDLYNIGSYSMALHQCRSAGECPSQIQRDYAIALGFSCFGAVMNVGLLLAGVGLIPALAAGFVLMAVQMATMAVLKVIEYQTKYQTTIGEDFKNFFAEFFGVSRSREWQAVVNRTDWVNQMGNHARNYLEKTSEDVVAYAVGLGEIRGSEVVPGRSFINMKNFNVNNTMDLSTIFPEKIGTTILLCLPKRDPEKLYDKEPRNLDEQHRKARTSAVYACSNSFVMADMVRWFFKDKHKSSQIVYNLGQINDGVVVGSDKVNNKFYISDSKETLKIVGGTGNINNYIIKSSSFHGNIILNPAKNNFLHLNDINSTVVLFSWSTKFNNGRIQCDSDAFYLQALHQPLTNLSFYGRIGKQDRFFCDYSEHERLQTKHNKFIEINGYGGESVTNMDYIEDCRQSILYPFTHILGSSTRQLKYTTYVWLDFKAYTNESIHAVIEPRLSIFDVIFTTYPLFSSLREVKYHPKNRTLTWHLHHLGSVLELSIVPYYVSAEDQLSRVTAIFYDQSINSQIFPVIEEPADDRVLSVRQFNVYTSSSSAELKDVIRQYRTISSQISVDFDVATRITHYPTKKSFIFGSNLGEKFRIDATTKFVCARGGADTYLWTVESQEMAIIDNTAQDNLRDTLLMPIGKCSSLKPMRNDSDVTLICANINDPNSQYYLTLRNYILNADDSRHLDIYWNNMLYMILPDEWLSESEIQEEELPLAIIFSFGPEWHQTMIMTSNYKHLVLKRTIVDELTAYHYDSMKRDLVVTEKFFSGSTRSVMRFQNFFDDEQKVDSRWMDLNIYIYDGEIQDNVVPKVWSAQNLYRLFLDGVIEYINNGNDDDHNPMTDVMQEYTVKVTGEQQVVLIDHNPDPHRQMKLGLLTVFNAEPKDFQAGWSSNGTVLTLCARGTCVHVKNWCQSILHRLNRIVFTPENAVIKNLDHLDCHKGMDMLEESRFITMLHEKFTRTQKELVLLRSIPDTDHTRLIRCIGIVYFSAVAEEYVHWIFGFQFINEAGEFLERNSNDLITKDSLEKLSVDEVKTVFKTWLEIFMIRGGMTKDDRMIVEVLEERISWLDKGKCWTRFINGLVSKLGKKKTSLILIKKTDHLVKCLTKLKKRQG